MANFIRAQGFRTFTGETLATKEYVEGNYFPAFTTAPEANASAPKAWVFKGETTADFITGHTYTLNEVEGVYSWTDATAQGAESLLDPNTGNLRHDLNPVAFASMQNATGEADVSKVKFIGDVNVSYGPNGEITVRIGPALNCSLLNGTDGISTATVTATASGSENAVISSAISNGSTTGAVTPTFKDSADAINITCGTGVTTGNATSGDGNAVHFEGSGKDAFKLYLKAGSEVVTFNSAPITGNGTFDMTGTEGVGATVTVANYKAEPRGQYGASGFCGNVSFKYSPMQHTDWGGVAVTKIEQLADGVVVATWNNSSNITYAVVADDATATPSGSMAPAAFRLGTETFLNVSGVKHLVNTSKAIFNAIDMANYAYPAANPNKLATVAPAGGNWFTPYTLTYANKAQLTAFSDAKDTLTTWSTPQLNLNIGDYANASATVTVSNLFKNGTAETVSYGRLLICDANGYTASTHGTISDSARYNASWTKGSFANVNLSVAGNTDLQVFNGYIQYPTDNYEMTNGAISSDFNPNYSNCIGDRYYYVKFSKAGSMPGGTIVLASPANIASALSSDQIVVEVAKEQGGQWYNINFSSANNAIGKSNSSYGATSKLVYVFSDGDATNNIWCRITMKQGCTAKIGSVTLEGGSIA